MIEIDALQDHTLHLEDAINIKTVKGTSLSFATLGNVEDGLQRLNENKG
jgi:hypothetical protein